MMNNLPNIMNNGMMINNFDNTNLNLILRMDDPLMMGQIGPIRERFEFGRNNFFNNISQNIDINLNINHEIDKLIDFSDVEKGNIYVNLIHYDANIKNDENNEYYRYFSVKLIGSYYIFDEYDMLKLFLTRLKQIPYSPCYILLISGDQSNEILKEFHSIDFINNIIIFCFNVNKYTYLKEKYNKIKIITDKFS